MRKAQKALPASFRNCGVIHWGCLAGIRFVRQSAQASCPVENIVWGMSEFALMAGMESWASLKPTFCGVAFGREKSLKTFRVPARERTAETERVAGDLRTIIVKTTELLTAGQRSTPTELT